MKKFLWVLPIVTLASCMSFSDKPMRSVRNAMAEQMPQVRLEKEIAINIGGGLFNVLDLVALNDANLSEIDKVQVAVYSVVGDLKSVDYNSLSFHDALLEQNSDLVWDRIVRVREADEQVWVFAGMNVRRNSLDAISVFVLEADELVLINIDGDMNEMMEFALEQSHGRRSHHEHGAI